MDDLISRKAAIDALVKHEKSRGHNYTLFVDIVSECEEIIRDLPTAGIQEDWISVKKRRPEIPIRVQVQLDNSWILTAYYDEGKWYPVPDWGEPIEGVLAWRPLPEPYVEGEDESN